MWGLENVSATTPRGRFVVLCLVMAFTTLLTLLEVVLFLNWAPLLAALFGWAFVLVYGVLEAGILHRGAGAVASLTLPSGSSTPSVNQHSNIQALVAKGQYAQAAEAYRQVIGAQPEDLVACEQLTQLALRELKDYDLALFALRQAEQRSPEARRRAGYALLAASVYRDNLKDYGKAIVELRRILARYPDVPNAGALRAEIEELKVMHFEAR
ncbi:MAG TPA: tetratricopeptide repeat protein, partial [Gemmatimonadales bacterium]|nr:tetratricopeptide repeat protein [Gemmatimonadales bacterium]